MRTIIDDEGRDYLEELDTLRELALCGPEEKREEAHRAYEELRSKLLTSKRCETPDQTNVTKELVMADKTITCADCGKSFTFSQGEQEVFQQKGMSEPKRCEECRQAKKTEGGGGGRGGSRGAVGPETGLSVSTGL